MQWESPERIRFVRLLGEGGFGRVYLANVSWKTYTRTLAVKHLHNVSAAEADFVARQRDEARMLAQLNHDHIVKVHSQFELDGHPAVLMEAIEGVDARQLLRKGRLPPKAALELVAAVADALHEAWNATVPGTDQAMRVVHRDIKPGNLLLSRSGVVKVVDFGAAQAEIDRSAVTRAVESDGELFFDQLGTVNFMAPERFRGLRPTPAVDVFALGMVLVSLLSNAPLQRPPVKPRRFEAYVRDLLTLVHEATPEGEFIRPLLHLLWSMLSFEAEGRPTASEVRDSCLELAEQVPGEGLSRYARRVVPELLAERERRYVDSALPDDVLLSGVEPTLKVAVDAERDTKPNDVRRGMWIILGGLVLGLGIGALALLAPVDEPPPPTQLAETPEGLAGRHPTDLDDEAGVGREVVAEGAELDEGSESPDAAPSLDDAVEQDLVNDDGAETLDEAAPPGREPAPVTKPPAKPSTKHPPTDNPPAAQKPEKVEAAPDLSSVQGATSANGDPGVDQSGEDSSPAAPACPVTGGAAPTGPHEIRVATSDGSSAEIFVNGRSKGKAPLTMALAAGAYTLCAQVGGDGVQQLIFVNEHVTANRYVLRPDAGSWRAEAK